MDEIIFYIEDDIESGYNARAINHSIFTQGDTIEDLKKNIKDALNCHFESGKIPHIIKLHFVHQEMLEMA
ncbi:MAG: 2-oxoisovalerate dehydrogenase [Candidatus Kapabacteria bacterium]|nr:2-oxoisovalerate dehydrogenase [Candidatus Kapabacteria bacterium]